MVRKHSLSTGLVVVLLSACGSPPGKPVEDLGGGRDVSKLVLRSLQGTRDGERLEIHGTYGDGSETLSLRLLFKVAPHAKLESGTWTGLGESGTVRERSVTFLGGQSGPPSIGGRFDLIGPEDRIRYRVRLPTQELKRPL